MIHQLLKTFYFITLLITVSTVSIGAPVCTETQSPVITSDFCAVSALSEISGTSTESAGTTINIYSGLLPGITDLLVGTTTVQADGSWTLKGLSLGVGLYITATAKADGKLISPPSAESNVSLESVVTLGIPTNPTTCSGSDGTLTLVGLENNTSYDVEFNLDSNLVNATVSTDGLGVLTLTGLTAGSYSDFSVSSGGCVSNEICGVDLSDPLPINIGLESVSVPSVCGLSDGFIVLNGLDASTNYQVAFTDEAGPQSLSVTSDALGLAIITGLETGLFSDISVSANGCTSNVLSDLVSISSLPLVSLGSLTHPSTCGVADGSIDITGLAGLTAYDVTVINTSGTVTSSLSSDLSGDLSISALEADEYKIKIELLGCEVTFNTSLGDLLEISLGATIDPQTCGGLDGSIELLGLLPNTTYQVNYTNVTPQSVAVMSDALGGLSISGLGEGEYTDLQVAVGGCKSNSLVGPFDLSEPLAPVVSVLLSTNPTLCGLADGTIVLSGLESSKSYDVQYTNSLGVQSTTLSADILGNILIPGLLEDNYSDISVASDGCTSNILSCPVPLLGFPEIGLGIVANPTSCGVNDGTILLAGLLGNTNYDVSYTNGTGIQTTNLNSDALGNLIITGLAADDYSELSVESGGCTSNVIGDLIQLVDGLAPTIALGNVVNLTDCLAADGSIEIGGLGLNLDYDVSFESSLGPQTATISSDGSGNLAINGLSADIYENIRITTLGGCVSLGVGPVSIICDDETEYDVPTFFNDEGFTNGEIVLAPIEPNGAIVCASLANATSLPPGLSLDTDNGNIEVTDASLITANNYSFDISTTDNNGGVTEQTVTMNITPDNDATYTVTPAQNIDDLLNGEEIASVSDDDGSVISSIVSTGTLPVGTTLDPTAGTISVTDESILVPGDYNFEITSVDSTGGFTVHPIQIVINADDEAVPTTFPALPVNLYNNTDTVAFVTDPDGVITNTALSNGTLPDGLAIDDSGLVYVSDNTQLTEGIYNFEITTTDPTGGKTITPLTIEFTAPFIDTEAVYLVEVARVIDTYTNGETLASVTDADGVLTASVITVGTLPLGTAMDAVTGEITVTDATQLVDGSYDLSITTTDINGETTDHNITIDLLAVDIEAVYVVEAARVIDTYTNGETLASVTDADGALTASVITVGTLPLGTAMDAVTGEITVTDATQLVDGSYDLSITTTDINGETTDHNITIELLAVDIEAVYVVEAARVIDTYTNGETLATVTDADGVLTASVITVGTLPLGTAMDAVTGEITVTDATQLVDGSYYLSITTTDINGETTDHNITIDLLAVDNEAVYVVEAARVIDTYTNGETLASVTDADGVLTASVISVGTLPLGTAMDAVTGEITVTDATQLVDGSYDLSITTTDINGESTDHTITIELLADTEAAYSVNPAQPTDSYSIGDKIAIPTDADGSIISASIVLGSLPAGVILNVNGELEVSDNSLLGVGNYSVDILTTDALGGKTTSTVEFEFTLPGTDIEAVYVVEAARVIDTYTNGETLASVTDADGVLTASVITVGTLPLGTAMDAVTGEITVTDATQLVNGSYDLSITTTDINGETTDHTITIDLLAVDIEAVYVVEAARVIDTYTNGDTLASVTDADGVLTASVITVGTLPLGTAMDAVTGEITVTDATQLVAGSYDLSITTTDINGETTNHTITIELLPVDIEAVYVVEAARVIDTYTNGETLASVTDADGVLTASVITVGTLPLETTMDTVTGEITVTDATQLVDGSYDLSITTTDINGETTDHTITIELLADTEAAYSVNPAQPTDSYSNGDKIAIPTDADGSIISASIVLGSLPAGVILNVNGELEVSDNSLLGVGNYSVDILTTDALGGKTTSTVEFEFTLPGTDIEAVYAVEAARVIDTYANGETLASVTDADGVLTASVITVGTLPLGTAMDAVTGEITVTDATQLVDGSYDLSITTTDINGETTDHTITIELLPIAPVDIEAVYVVEAARVIDTYTNGETLASVTDADGALTASVITVGTLPLGTTMDAVTGEITVTDATQLVAGSYDLSITTTDINGDTTDHTITIELLPIAPVDIEAIYVVEAARVIDTYTNGETLASVTDADGVLTASVISVGTLPLGTAMDAVTGEITVTDATQLVDGSYDLSITTTDINGETTDHNITIELLPIAPVDIEAIYVVEAARVIDTYTNGETLASVTDADGVLTASVISVGTLPLGTAMDAVTGEITVTDATQLVDGSYDLSITTTDINGETTDHNITIELLPIAPVDIEAIYVVEAARVIDTYTNGETLASVTDADGVLTASVITVGTLPLGTAMDAVTGEITVTDATQLVDGSYDLSITTTDINGETTDHTITIELLPIAPVDIEAVYVVEAARVINTYTNGELIATVVDTDGAIISAQLSAGYNLPNGIGLNADGSFYVLDLLLLEAGEFDLEITTEDENGGFTTQIITLILLPNPTTDLEITGVVAEGPFPLNSEVVLLVRVENIGSTDATEVNVVTSSLMFAKITSLVASKGTIEDNSNDWIIGDISPGEIQEMELTLKMEGAGIQSYTFEVSTTSDDIEANNNFTSLEVEVEEFDRVKVAKGYSPNGDNVDDEWKIGRIIQFPNNKVKVFNRWGNLVFEADGYNNEQAIWNGTLKTNLAKNGADVPDGTYFYVIDLGDGEKPLSGYVMIKR